MPILQEGPLPKLVPCRRDLDRRFPAGQIQGSVFHRIVAPLPRGDHAHQKGMSWRFGNDVGMSMGPIVIVWGCMPYRL